MLTPDQIDARRDYLAKLSIPRGPLQPDAAGATVNNPAWFRRINGEPVPTSSRQRLHNRILEKWQSENPDVLRNRLAIVMAGPPGAGKSSTQRHLFDQLDRREWRELDADTFKRYLLEAAVADGSISELLPLQSNDANEVGYSLYPLELSALVHRESTDFLFKMAQRDAVLKGENLIIDGTLAWKDHAESVLNYLQQADYKIHVVDVEASRQVSAERIVRRWKNGLTEALKNPDDPITALGGRWVPETAVNQLFTEFRASDQTPLLGKCVTELNAFEASQECTAVSMLDIYRTLTVDGDSAHIERWERNDKNSEIIMTWAAPAEGTCSEVACGQLTNSQGICMPHYRRWIPV